MDIKEKITSNPLLFDGSMGTYFAELHPEYTDACEAACLDHPEYIKAIHLEYLNAGCQAITANTFSVNPLNPAFAGVRAADTIRAAVRIAREAVAEYAESKKPAAQPQVFASIGPVGHYAASASTDEIAASYTQVIDVFLDEGVSCFLLETNSSCEQALAAAAYIRSRLEDAFISVSFAVQPDGYTRDGRHYQELFRSCATFGRVDAVGMNCICGALHMKNLLAKADLPEGMILSAMPNAGYPRIVGNRTYYDNNPEYFASQLAEICESGASIVGGCCGTRPEFIRAAAALIGSGDLAAPKKVRVIPVSADRAAKTNEAADNSRLNKLEADDNSFWNKLEAGKKVIAVELDPPRQDDGTKFMSGAWALKGAGIDAMTIADCPTARASMDSSIMACKVHRELGIDVIPHMTCRDRNLNATKALLLGLSIEGIRNVLAVTGDPVPTAERDEVKSVYQFNSKMLAKYITSLNENEFAHRFRIHGALNINARRFDVQLDQARKKIENGISCFLTQPVLTEQAFENLKRAHDELDARILGGIIPVVSERNARFMNSEISGITVDDKITEMYAGKNRDECTKLAIEISSEIGSRIRPYVDGYYLMTPFSRTDIITEIIKNLRS